MDFSETLNNMKYGGTRSTRVTWEDKRQMCSFENGKLYKVILCKVANYTYVKLGWNPTINDILAEDWKNE